MDTIRTMGKTVAVALACGGLRADLVTLRNSDGCAVGSGATDLNRGTPSFTTFNAYTDGAGNLWGWDNDAAPAAGHDYLVSGHNQMIALLEEGVVQSFAGDSLTLDRGVVYCANAAKDTSGKIAGWIDFPSLTMKCGAIYPNGNYLNSLKVTGSIAVDGSSHGYEVGFPYASGNRWQQKGVGFHSASSQVGLMTDIAATVTSSEQDTLCVSGLHDPCLYHGNKEVYRMAVGAYVYNMRLSGDFSGFRGRVLTAPKVNLTIDRADFGGSVTLSNIASLAVGPSIPALRVSGDMELVDGWIDLQPGKTIEVGGSLSSSFADPATFVTEDGVNTYNGKGFDAATGYSRHEIEADDMAEGYNGTPQWKAWNHSRSWVRRTFRNAICIGYDEYAVEANVGSPLSAPATLAATAATLDATLVRSWVDGSVLRVGDLTLDGATLDYSNKSFVLAVTNSLTILSPVRLVLPEGWTQVKIMTLAPGMPMLDTSKIVLPDGCEDRYRHSFVVRTEGAGDEAVQAVYLIDRQSMDYKTSDLFVHSPWGESNSDRHMLYESGYWKQGANADMPLTAEFDYVTCGRILVTNRNGFVHLFPGRSLTIKSTMFVSAFTSGEIGFADLYTVNGASITNYPQATFNFKMSGRMTVVNDAAAPLRINTMRCDGSSQGGYRSSFCLASELHGSPHARIKVEGCLVDNPNSLMAFLWTGDASHYEGAIDFIRNQPLEIGTVGRMPGTLTVHEPSCALSTCAANGTENGVAALNVPGMPISVAPSNTFVASNLTVDGRLAVTGGGVLAASQVSATGIDVSAGFLRADDADGAAFADTPLTFASGCGVAVDLDSPVAKASATGFSLPASLTAGDRFAVRFMGDAESYERLTYAAFSGAKAQVEALAAKLMKVNATPASRLLTSYAVEEIGDVAVLRVTFLPKGGLSIVVR